jgi:hypothetical protein
MKPRGTATTKIFPSYIKRAVQGFRCHPKDILSLPLSLWSLEHEIRPDSSASRYFPSGEAVDVVMKLVALCLLLPNSLHLRLFGGFDVFNAGSDPLLKPKTKQSFEFCGVKVQASDVSSKMAGPSCANRTRRSTIRLPALTPENSTQGLSLSGRQWRNVPEQFWLQPITTTFIPKRHTATSPGLSPSGTKQRPGVSDCHLI